MRRSSSEMPLISGRWDVYDRRERGVANPCSKPMSQPILVTCALLLVSTVVLMMFLEVFEIAPISTRLDWSTISRWKMEQRKPGNFAELMAKMPAKRTSKWIVVTSIQGPTEDVKRLAAYPDWTLVVVGDTKTPADWSLTDVHYLSIETQIEMGFESVERLPTRSYTRKNAGYLYAIANGAQWIYDTDDDNKPYGKGLEQFEYVTDKVRGLRFTTLEWENTTMQEALFNPYRHFGRPDMWPRGFPLEHIKNHDHREGCYRLCRVQRPPAVQQGIVQKDPDVDAIYRLMHAEPETGLDETFSEFAPPVILAPGTYAPWNSQNTLFSRTAFFGLFLPTTVAFRVTDIWRSYFTQALLHAAGETISFVPVNAIQKRNAHSYLKDFDEEIDVYDKSGTIVQFIDGWKCKESTMDKCTIELAGEFAARGFWGDEDAQLVVHWVLDLQKIGYVFPAVRPSAETEYTIGEDKDLRRNCRRAHVSFLNDLPVDKKEPAEKRAATKINNFGDLKDWCDESNSTKSEHWYFPAPDQLAEATTENQTMMDNYQTVAIITNNWQWGFGMGMLQRMYEANFAMLIFCGHYPKQGRDAWRKEFPEGMGGGDVTYPNLKRPINYIDLSNEEVRWGYLMYYCLAKVEELKLQNVKGYVMYSDDVIFNFWNPLNHNIAQGTKRAPGWGPWWPNKQFGWDSMNRTIQLFSGKYKDDWEVQHFVQELKKEIGRVPRYDVVNMQQQVTDPMEYLMVGDGWVVADWMYIPASNISFVGMFAQLADEGELFHELFTSKMLHILPSEGTEEKDPERILFLWATDRLLWPKKYTAHLHAIHPIKLTEFQKMPERATFCDAVLDQFYHNTFRIGNWTN